MSRRQSAVVRGAALRGLEGIAPRMKQSRRHYGVGLNDAFREGIDPEENSYFDDFQNQKFCRHRVKWLISKVYKSPIIPGNELVTDKDQGDKILTDTSRKIRGTTEYTPDKAASTSFSLYSTALNDPPDYHTDSSMFHYLYLRTSILMIFKVRS